MARALLDRHQILHTRHDAQRLRVTPRIETDRTQRATVFVDLGDVAAALAALHGVAELLQRDAQLAAVLLTLGHEEHGKALGRLFAHARQAREQLDQAFQAVGEHGPRLVALARMRSGFL